MEIMLVSVGKCNGRTQESFVMFVISKFQYGENLSTYE